MIINKILKQKIKKIPQKPGTYIFRDKAGRIVYVGKAVDLRKRVQSHFLTLRLHSGYNSDSQFIKKVIDLDWIKTDNEKQALLLEDQLIKKYKPRYNIHWKDDKSYFWVAFSNDEWPRVLVVHKSHVTSDRDKLIGPFVNAKELRHALRSLRRIIPFRTCKNCYEKPCLQWHLGLCVAHNPNSKVKTQKSKLQLKVQNYLNSLNTLSQFLRLYAGEPIRIEAYDISNIQGKYATGSMIVFYGDKPSKSDYRKFRIKTVRSANDAAMIREILRRRLGHPEWPYPDLILIDGGRPQLAAAQRVANSLWHLVKKQRDSKPLAISHRPYAIVALAKREEEIYTEYSPKTLQLSKLPESLRLAFQHIRNEAHRFAIFYYRYLHAKGANPNKQKTITK